MGKRTSSTLATTTAIVEIVETPIVETITLSEILTLAEGAQEAGEEIPSILSPSTALTTIPSTGAPEGEAERIPLTLLHIKGARKEGKETIIHSNLWGKERWFAKKRLHSYTNLGNGEFLILIPTSELNYRDAELTEPLATLTPHTGEASLLKQGGAHF